MKLAVCLYKFFPFGGLARDFLRIMTICRSRGYEIDVFVMEWQGDIPDGFNVHVIPTRAWTNHGKVASFIAQVSPQLTENDYDLVIGFNKIPNLDLYYAADPCYLDRVKSQKYYFLHKLSRRFKFYASNERAVFGYQSTTVSLMISDVQQALFKKNYHTSDDRLLMLPPGIDPGRKRPDNWLKIRDEFRLKWLKNDEKIILMVGTGFKTKGVDRAIRGLALVPKQQLKNIQLFIVGDGDPSSYLKLAKQLSVQDHVRFFGGRSDIPDFLFGADMLLHPARKDNTGTVILEAIVAGLPILVTDVCGYAKHVTKSETGLVVSSPFDIDAFGKQLTQMLQSDGSEKWSENGLAYAESEDLYSMPEKVADIIDNMVTEKGERHN
ncbi:MAG: glycosyltransferase family 4 protein [Piscirickettsiaceae bacterium]|nr:glycosyltransferase family 4 protein [Piscirickettsiaceae bacterium]